VNASQVVEKGDPKNFIPAEGIERIATAFNLWQEEEKFAQVVTRQQVAKEDYNISPSRYIHVADAEHTGRSRRFWQNWKPWTPRRRWRTRR
jgi:type I restriction enzyme M protein